MSRTATLTVHPQAIFASSQVSLGATVVHRLVHNRWRTSSTATRHAVPTPSPGASTGGPDPPLTGLVRPPSVPPTRPPVPRPRSQGEGERCWSPGAPCRPGLRAVRGHVLSRGSAAPLCTLVGHLTHRGLSPRAHAVVTHPRQGRRGRARHRECNSAVQVGNRASRHDRDLVRLPTGPEKSCPQGVLVGRNCRTCRLGWGHVSRCRAGAAERLGLSSGPAGAVG